MAALHGNWEETGKRGAPGKERRREEWRGVQGFSRGSSHPQGGKQDVARRQPCARHAGVLPTGRRRKKVFAEKPPRVWRISGQNKNCTLCKIW
jgi:hypothetical protein